MIWQDDKAPIAISLLSFPRYGFVSNYINIPICQYVFGPLGEPGRASIQQCNISVLWPNPWQVEMTDSCDKVSLTQMPWNFKIFYGLLLDRLSFFGSRRKGWNFSCNSTINPAFSQRSLRIIFGWSSSLVILACMSAIEPWTFSLVDLFAYEIILPVYSNMWCLNPKHAVYILFLTPLISRFWPE